MKYSDKNNVKKGCENMSVIKPYYLNQNGWTSDDYYKNFLSLIYPERRGLNNIIN